MLLLLSADFFQNDFFKKKVLSGTLSESQMVWIQIRTNILSFLIWDQTAAIMQFKVISRQHSKERVNIQAHSQAEARKHGLQHHIGLDVRNHDFVACGQQDADAQSDQCLCYWLSEK